MYVTFPVTQRQLLEVRRARRRARDRPRGRQGPARRRRSSTTRIGRSTSSTCRSTRAPTRCRCARRCRTRTGLVDGQLVTVDRRDRQARAALLIPQQAVQIDQTGRYVLRSMPRTRCRCSGSPSASSATAPMSSTNGLQLGERVITEGLQKVRPGMVVDRSGPGGAGHAGGRWAKAHAPRSSSTGRGCRSSSRS